MSTAVRPQHDLQPIVTPGEPDPNATRWGWSAVLNIETADRTASKSIGHQSIPMRALVAFETIPIVRPSERDNAQWGEEDRVDKSAKTCAYEIYQDYHQQGFVRLYSLVGRPDAEEIYAAIYPNEFPTLKQALDYFASDEFTRNVQSLPESRFKAGRQAAGDLSAAAQRAWVFANETLDNSETEIGERANGAKTGKKRYDPLDLHLYEQTERVKPEFQAAEATAQHGAAVGDAIGEKLGKAFEFLAERQAAQDERMAQIAEQNATTQAALLKLLETQTAGDKKGSKAGK
jgi:hypothetical protein